MEDPAREIASVVLALCETTPSLQRQTLETYFTEDAAFIHPMCRTGSFHLSPSSYGNDSNDTTNNYTDGADPKVLTKAPRWLPILNSRTIILGIYRWYKIMSPRITLTVDSVAWDQSNNFVYLRMRQNFKVVYVPFYSAPVYLHTMLTLHRDKQNGLYYIKQQEDFYQADQLFRFLWPGGVLMSFVFMAIQWCAGIGCLLLALIFAPVSWVEEGVGVGKKRIDGVGLVDGNMMDGNVERNHME